jgi:lysophospholipase L1-like esterase
VSPRLANTRFMAFGDSITTGEVTVPVSRADQDERSAPTVIVPSAAYPSVLADLLRSSYPQQAGAIEVFNEGRGAEAVTNALPRFRDAFDARRPEVVLLMEGYNDICCGGRSAGENAAAAVAAIADEARHRGARVFIANLAPSKPGFRAGSAEALDGFNAALRSCRCLLATGARARPKHRYRRPASNRGRLPPDSPGVLLRDQVHAGDGPLGRTGRR